MYQIRTILSLCLSASLLLSACQYTGRQTSAPTITPIGQSSAEKITSKTIPRHRGRTQRTPPNKNKKETAKNPIEIAVIVSYFRFLNSLPEKALKQEHTRTQKEFSENSSAINRLRLAMLLGFTNTKHRDSQGALDLLNRYLEDPDPIDPMLRDFSFLLVSLGQQLKDQDKAYKAIIQQLKKGRTENKKLKKMIEELKTIEKNLVERDTAEKK